MKIEKISENQIRCTLTRDDLAEREIKISELAYGSEKAKSLFHDMMQQAAYEFGFEANDIPLMIEAIPTSSGSIVLTITRVDNPEELDTRFSKFSPIPFGEISEKKGASLQDRLRKLEGGEEFLDLINQVKNAVAAIPDAPEAEREQTKPTEAAEETEEESPSIRFFSFSALEDAIKASALLAGMYDGSNTLYKDEMNDIFILALTQSEYTSADFNRICNMLSEYGSAEPGNGATLAFLEEHCTVIAAKNAVQTLSSL